MIKIEAFDYWKREEQDSIKIGKRVRKELPSISTIGFVTLIFWEAIANRSISPAFSSPSELISSHTLNFTSSMYTSNLSHSNTQLTSFNFIAHSLKYLYKIFHCPVGVRVNSSRSLLHSDLQKFVHNPEFFVSWLKVLWYFLMHIILINYPNKYNLITIKHIKFAHIITKCQPMRS